MTAMELTLADLRVLDITGVEAAFLGRFLADFGADVLHLSGPLPGRPSRTGKTPEHDNVLTTARNLNKRLLPEDIHSRELKRLAESADVILNSDHRLDALGLSSAQLFADKPTLLVVELSSFGNGGPKGSWRGSNLTITAAGGFLALCGEPTEAPVETKSPQGYGQAAAQALAGLMLALRMRDASGQGAIVEVSSQEAVVNCLSHTQQTWLIEGRNEKRGTVRKRGNVYSRLQYRCKDGFVAWHWYVGTGFGRKTLPMVEWMREEGKASSALEVDWENLSILDLEQDTVDQWEREFGAFLLGHDRATIANEALKRGILLFPVQTANEVLQDPHLADREFFAGVAIDPHTTLRLPGQYFAGTCLPRVTRHEPPKLGQAEWISERNPRFVAHEGDKTLQPFVGVRVLDLSWQIAGPFTTRYMAMFGAEVIRVESRKRPDGTRMVGPYVEKPGLERSAGFANSNLSKRSALIDLQHPRGRDIVIRLAEQCDIVVENFRPGVMSRLGIGYDVLSRAKPDLIMVSLSMLGQTGRRSRQPGLGIFLKALSGFDADTLSEAGEPAGPTYAYTDMIVPWFALAAISMALRRRDGGLGGGYIDVSQYEVSLHLMAESLTAAQLPESAIRPGPLLSGVYPTASEDRWFALALWTDNHWEKLREAAGLASTGGSAALEARGHNLHDEIARWTKTMDAEALQGLLRPIGLDCHVVAQGSDLHVDEQLSARQHFLHAEHPKLKGVLYDAPSFRISGCEPVVTRPPLMGEDTGWVLQTILGMSDEEILEEAVAGSVELG